MWECFLPHLWNFNGQEIINVQFLTLLPDHHLWNPRTVGKTKYKAVFSQVLRQEKKVFYIYNVCDLRNAIRVESRQSPYTTGVPAMISSMMVVTGRWKKPVYLMWKNLIRIRLVEALNKWGLPWKSAKILNW